MAHMATLKAEQVPFDNLFEGDAAALLSNPDGDLNAAVESFLNLPDVAWLPTSSSGGADSLFSEQQQLQKPKKAAKKAAKAKSSRATQKQLLAAIMEALADADDDDDEDDAESPAPSPRSEQPAAKRSKSVPTDEQTASRPLPHLAGACSNESSDAPSSTLLDSFLHQLPQVNRHLDTLIASVGPNANQHIGAQQLDTPDESGASCMLRRCASTSSVDSSAAEAAAAAAAALAANSRKRKSPEPEAVSSQQEGEMTREMRRALGAAILGSGPCPVSLPTAFPAAMSSPAPLPPVVVSSTPVAARTLVDGPLRLRLPVAAEQLAAAPAAIVASAIPAREDLNCGMLAAPGAPGAAYNESSEDDMGGDAEDDWMPRSRGRKDRQQAGGRIKARSMAERQRRERISEGLQKLRMVVRGQGDTATMLDNAVGYVQKLQKRVASLETAMLLHQAQACKESGPASQANGQDMFRFDM